MESVEGSSLLGVEGGEVQRISNLIDSVIQYTFIQTMRLPVKQKLCGDVNLVRIVRDRNTGIGKGFAFVSFKDSAAVPIALKMDGSSFEGRQLRVTRIQKKNKRVVGSEAIRNNTKKAKRRIVNEQKLSKFMTNNRKALFEKEGNSSTLKKSIRKKIKKRQRKANSKSVIS
ncbi:unnamed protein product [Toxocara canis]|uniref:RRM domain-containing protein n=1 Tax=Toxocara canis TaxID=6265 RepID=A0A183UUL4_TOXCA|nr:unnamed protein product [Toxocara canis]